MRTNINSDELSSKGPWKFDAPELAPGESYTVDLRNMEFNGQKGWFRKYLPLDDMQVTNSDNTAFVSININGVYDDGIPPNVAETYEDKGITKFTVQNESGSATIAAGDLSVTLEKNAYSANDRAREQARRGVVDQLTEKFLGVTPGDFRGQL